jgi:hypothetical protein
MSPTAPHRRATTPAPQELTGSRRVGAPVTTLHKDRGR